MPTPEEIEAYRKMTPGERFNLTIKLSRKYQHSLSKGTPSQVARRFQRMRNANDEENKRLLAAFAKLKEQEQTNVNEPPAEKS